MKTLVIIPSRLAATRLPGKPLLKINGLSIISHVVKRAEEANIGEVYVAAGDKEIVDEVKKNGGQAILTDINHKTGTDRIYEAVNKIKNKDIELVMNLQGDEPIMNTNDIKNLQTKMIKTNADLGTLASNIFDQKILKKKDVVKVITSELLKVENFPEAITFKRKLIDKTKNVYHHLGIYCYKLQTLKKFVSFKQSHNEINDKLEQLRALDNNIKINVALAKDSPIGVDTEEDFVAIKKIMEYKNK